MCGAGLLLRRPTLVAISTSWLVLGDILWAVDLLSGGVFYPTSLLTHVGGLAIGLLALRRSGWPEGTWWRALLALAALQQCTRLLTPPAANVNLAFSVYPGWEPLFPHYSAYWAALLLLAASSFRATEAALQRLLGPLRPPR